MKKNIDYALSAEEKQLLRQKKISQKMLRDHAPDEVAALLEAAPQRAKELQALAEFQSIPSLGIAFAKDLIEQGYYSLAALKGKSALELYDAYERHCGCWSDPCVEDSYRLLAHYVDHHDDSKRWWNFTAERKAYREKHGYPADRPQRPWYELVKFPKMRAYLKKEE